MRLDGPGSFQHNGYNKPRAVFIVAAILSASADGRRTVLIIK